MSPGENIYKLYNSTGGIVKGFSRGLKVGILIMKFVKN
jgi:hypothetical protein